MHIPNNGDGWLYESPSNVSDVLGENLEAIYGSRIRAESRKRNNPERTNLQPQQEHFYKKCETILKSLDGQVRQNDFITHDKSIALDHLYGMVLQSLGTATKVNKKWEFNRSLHLHFEKTFDDIFIAFLHWATVPVDSTALHVDGIGLPLVFPYLINVTMAFRRLEMYANWLNEDGQHILEPPIDPHVMRKTEETLKRHMQFNYDGHNQLLWWTDCTPDATSELSKFSPMEKARFYVWVLHSVMFDKKAQVNGSVLITRQAQVHHYSRIPFQDIFSIGRLCFTCSSMRVKHIISIESSPLNMFFFWFLSPSLKKIIDNRIHRTSDKGETILRKLGIYGYMPLGYRS